MLMKKLATVLENSGGKNKFGLVNNFGYVDFTYTNK